jgi:hypothetical protein
MEFEQTFEQPQKSDSYNSYLLGFILILSLVSLGLSVYLLLKKESNDSKDKNLKIALNIVNKEGYEEPSNNRNKEKCKKLKLLLGDSNNKGLNDIYKNMTGKESPLKNFPFDCEKISDADFNNLNNSFVEILSELTVKSIENNDREKGYYDLVALWVFIVKGLYGQLAKINTKLDSNGNIDTIEIIQADGKKMIPSVEAATIKDAYKIKETPSSNKEIEKTKEKARKVVKEQDVNSLEKDNNSNMKVSTFGNILFWKYSISYDFTKRYITKINYIIY